jgi:PKD repeat protein
MQRDIKKQLSVMRTLFIVAFFFIPVVPFAVKADNPSLVQVHPANTTVAAQQTFTLNIRCIPSQPIKSFELKISFNPSVIQANAVTEGTIFNDYSTFFNHGIINNNAGTIINIYNLILGPGNTSDPGTFVTISFTAKIYSGTSPIDLYDIGVTDEFGYVPITVSDGAVTVTSKNQPPIFSSVTPANGSTNQPLSLMWKIPINDPQGDRFTWTIQCSNGRANSGTGATNGTKTLSLSGLAYLRRYTVWVNATDPDGSGIYTRRRYTFTTKPNLPPVFGAPLPANGSTNQPLSLSCSIPINDPEGDRFTWTIRCSNGQTSSGSNAFNGTKSLSLTGLTYSTTYHWYIVCKDSGSNRWKNASYWFTTVAASGGEPPPDGGETPPDDGGEEPPSGSELNHPPNTPVQPIGPTFIERGVSYEYTSSASDFEGDQVRLRFDWGDGNFSSWSSFGESNKTVSASHIWHHYSNFSIRVIAQDEYGVNSSWSSPLTVTVSEEQTNQESPILSIEAPDKEYTNQTIFFDVTIQNESASEILSYMWDFGDGTTGTGKNQSHVYTAPGVYSVHLTVIDTTGKSYTKTFLITISAEDENTIQHQQSTLWYGGIALLLGLCSIGIALIIYFRETLLRIVSNISINLQQKKIHLLNTKSMDRRRKKNSVYHIQHKTTDNQKYSKLNDSSIENEVDKVLLSKIENEIDKM